MKIDNHILAMRFEVAEKKILDLIGKRINEIGKLTATDVRKMEALRNIGADVESMQKYLTEASVLDMKDVQKAYNVYAKDLYEKMGIYYEAKGIEQVAYLKNKTLQNIVKSSIETTNGTLSNIPKSTVVKMSKIGKNGRRVTVYKSLKKTYTDVIDEAITYVQSGVEDYNSAIRHSINEIANSGVRYMDYASGYSMNLYSSVRNAVINGSRNMSQEMFNTLGEEFGSDGVEITAHSLCAPDHLEVQGRRYTNEEFEDIQSSLEREIGEYNCNHIAVPIVMGVGKSVYSDEMLDSFAESTTDANVDIGGKKYTRYECSQLQRKLENNIRKSKVKTSMLKSAGLDTKQSVNKTRILNNKYNELSKKAKLNRRADRLSVPKGLTKML